MQRKAVHGNASRFQNAEGGPSALSAIVARNLRRLRLHRGHSPEDLAELTEVPLLALIQVEAGKGEPTLETAWKIATALDIPFAALIADGTPRGATVVRKDKSKVLVSEDLGLTTRSLLPFEEDRRVEFYELRLAPLHRENSGPHAAGTTEYLFVARGALEVTIGREPPQIVNEGDTICFPSDLPHSYRNTTPEPATLYLVMTYKDSPNP